MFCYQPLFFSHHFILPNFSLYTCCVSWYGVILILLTSAEIFAQPNPNNSSILQVDSVSENQVSLSWKNWLNDTPKVTFELYQNAKAIHQTTQKTLTIRNLRPFTTYKFVLKAYYRTNHNIFKQSSEEIAITTKGFLYPQWTKIAELPTKKAEAGSIVYQNQLYVFPGITGYKDTLQTKPQKRYKIVFNNTTEVFNPLTHQWKPLAPLPNDGGLTHYGTCLVEDKVWLVGGRIAPHKALTDQVWVYDIPTNTWEKGPKLPKNLASGALLKLGRKLHFFAGGTHLSISLTQFCLMTDFHFILDLDNIAKGWKLFDSNFPLEARTIHASYVHTRGKFYLIGGQDGHDCGNEDYNKVFEYNPYSNEWKRIADLPRANSHSESSTFVIDGRLLVGGGERNGSSILEYDFEKDIWKQLDTLKDANGQVMKLIGTNIKVIDNQMIVSGGGLKSTNYNSTDATFMKDFVRNPQNRLGFLPDTMRIILENGQNTKVFKKSAWLWSLNGKVQYDLDLSELPKWIHLKENSSRFTDENADELIFTFLPQRIPPKNHTFQIKAMADGFETATLTIQIQMSESPQSFHLHPSLFSVSVLGFGFLVLLFWAYQKKKKEYK